MNPYPVVFPARAAMLFILWAVVDPLAFGTDRERPAASWRDIVERFDKDGDGKLSDEEKDAAREEIEAYKEARAERRRRDWIARFDRSGDGKLNEEEQAEADRARAEFIRRFDKDGDGKLDAKEKSEARKWLREEMKRRVEELLEKHDEDRDGNLNEDERGGALESGDGLDILPIDETGWLWFRKDVGICRKDLFPSLCGSDSTDAGGKRGKPCRNWRS